MTLVSAFTASAAIITDTDTLLSTVTQFSLGTKTFTLDKFDSDLGTLTGVRLIFNSSASSSVYFDAFNPASDVDVTGALGGLRLGVAMIVRGPIGDNTIYNQAVAGSAVVDQHLLGGETSPTYNVSGTSTSQYNILPANFGAWQSASPATITLRIAGTNSIENIQSATGSYQIVGSGSVSGDVTVEYTYTAAVPEPATMGLMGGALIGIALLRKRSNA